MIPEPFPHVIIDDFVSAELCRAACAEWPADNWPFWVKYEGARGDKFATRDPLRLTPACAEIIRDISRVRLSDLLGTTGSFPDLSLWGSGMNMILPGGCLPLHLDSDHNPITGWRRSASAMVYLSECEGGELHLWDGDDRAPAQTITPMAGRLVIFETSDYAWHSVGPVTSGRRLSLSLFFWRLPDPGTPSGVRPHAQF